MTLRGLNHVAIAVPDLARAADRYRALGATLSDPKDLIEHGVTVIFVELPNTKIELLYPLGAASPITAFLEKNPAGGIHHICFEVADVTAAAVALRDNGVRILGDGSIKVAAHGKPVLLHIQRTSRERWSNSKKLSLSTLCSLNR